MIELVQNGEVPEERLNSSVRRLLRQKFELGLFEHRHVDAEAADEIVGAEPLRAAGRRAQSQSVTVVANDGVLPLPAGSRVHVDGIDASTAAGWATMASDQSDADVTIVRVSAPFEQRPGAFESMFHSGPLEFPPDELERIRAMLRSGPAVLAVNLERPAVLTPFIDDAAAIVVTAGCSDEALLDVMFGRTTSRGHLPVALPASTAAIESSPTDMPVAGEHALYASGFGLDLPPLV